MEKLFLIVEEIFLTVLNMSITASYAIIFVLIIRLLLKKAPKVFSYVLWSVVAFRLIIPFSFESMFSLMPRSIMSWITNSIWNTASRSTNPVPAHHNIIYQQGNPVYNMNSINNINSMVQSLDSFANHPVYETTVSPGVNSLQIYITIAAFTWIAGLLIFLTYSIVSVLFLERQLKNAKLIGKNVFEAENLKTPFVLGLVKPRIYLPAGLKDTEKSYVLLHEKVHIQRKDHVIKALAFLILSVHWFNPLVWLAFILMSTDMELSCDERVLRAVNEDIKKPYANSLLSLATERLILNGSPLAFGEGNLKGRIKNILNYKKPGFWVIVISVIVVLTVGIGLAANPRYLAPIEGSSYSVKEILYQASIYSFSFTPENSPQFYVSPDFMLYSRSTSQGNWMLHGELNPCEIRREELLKLFIPPFEDNDYKIISQAELVYRTQTDEGDITNFYLVMRLRSGDVLLALGYDGIEKPHIRCLFRLERLDGNNSKTIGIIKDAEGINNRPGQPINELQKEKDVNEFKKDSESTKANEIAQFVEENLAIIMSSPKGASDPYACIQAHQEEYEKIKKLGGEEALQYMLSQFEMGKTDGIRGYIMMLLCKDMLGVRNNVTDENLTPQEWYKALSIREEIKLPDFTYDGSDPIEKLVYDTEIKRYSRPGDGFTIVAPKIFGAYEENGKLKVFVTTFSATYKLYGNILHLVGGSVVPSAITYTKDDNGNYILEKYEQAKDGADWQPSIRKFCTMPVTGKKIQGLAERIISHYTNRDDIHTLQWENLFKHLKANGVKDAVLFNSNGEIEFSMKKAEEGSMF